jgi:hypothetical protein
MAYGFTTETHHVSLTYCRLSGDTVKVISRTLLLEISTVAVPDLP